MDSRLHWPMLDQNSYVREGVAMAKKLKALPEFGSPNAEEIYGLVGTSLSYWEASEDIIMGLFGWLCKEAEPTAFAAYVEAPRSARNSMLKLALETYSHRFSPEELSEIRMALSRIDKLASVRNEIAHGHVSNVNMMMQSSDGTQAPVAQGNYLLPAFNEGVWHERSFRFHHTAETIFAFQEEVRDHRWKIFEAHSSAMMREQQSVNLADTEWHMQRRIASDIISRKIMPENYAKFFRSMNEWPA